MSDLKDFVIEDGVLKEYNGLAGDIVIPKEVYQIAGYVFVQPDKQRSKKPSRITIPKTVKSIDKNWLSLSNTDVSYIEVAEENKDFCSEDGV